jgi:hypothetical protein
MKADYLLLFKTRWERVFVIILSCGNVVHLIATPVYRADDPVNKEIRKAKTEYDCPSRPMYSRNDIAYIR